MIEIIRDFHEISEFIGKLNKEKKTNIAFCSTENELILKDLNELDNSCFLGVREKGKIIALLGGDIYNNTCEVWGPFLQGDNAHLLPKLFEELKKEVKVGSFQFFVNEKNLVAQKFLDEIEAQFISAETILELINRGIEYEIDDDIYINNQDDYSEIASLHNLIFKDTYLQGSEMVEGIDEEKHLTSIKSDNKIYGYSYFEVSKEFNEGSIEYIGVKEEYRKLGYGEKLLKATLNIILNTLDIKELSLCVNNKNQKAINLYKKNGFVEKNIQHYYKIHV